MKVTEAYEYDSNDERDIIDVVTDRGYVRSDRHIIDVVTDRGYVRSDRLVMPFGSDDEPYDFMTGDHIIRVFVGDGTRVVVMTPNEVVEFEMRFDNGTPNAVIEGALHGAESFAELPVKSF